MSERKVSDEIAKLDPPDTFEEGGVKYGLGYPEEEKQEEGDWSLRQELAEAHVAANNERAQRQAAEKHIETLCDDAQRLTASNREFAQEINRLEDKVQAADEALRNALRLISYLIKDQSDD